MHFENLEVYFLLQSTEKLTQAAVGTSIQHKDSSFCLVQANEQIQPVVRISKPSDSRCSTASITLES